VQNCVCNIVSNLRWYLVKFTHAVNINLHMCCEMWLQESKLTVWENGEKDINQVPCMLCNQQLVDGGGPISIVCRYSVEIWLEYPNSANPYLFQLE